jgi:hypothetical protein
MFVDVPTSVGVPPIIAANDSGVNSFDGDRFASSARSVIIGMNTATTGVLLIKPAVKPVDPTVAPSSLRWLPRVNRAMSAPSRSTIPVSCTPTLRMSIAGVVTVAGLAKPAIAETESTPVQGSNTTRATSTPVAVTSLGTGSVTNKTDTTRISPTTIAMPVVIGGTATRFEIRRPG